MRCGLLLATALTALTVTAAHADDWCGYGAHEKSPIACGYSTATECGTAVGKGGTCFIDPDFARNSGRAARLLASAAALRHD